MDDRLLIAFLIALFVAASGSVAGQPVLTADHFPLTPGEVPFVEHFAENEDGQQTEAINALIALDGPDQFWDFGTIDYDTKFSDVFTVSDEAVGPGAGEPVLENANKTAHLFMAIEDEGITYEIDYYGYALLTEAELRELGFVQQIDFLGISFTMKATNKPAGALASTFPLAYGDSWTSEYVMEIDFEGEIFEFEAEDVYTVDGWGTLMGPGLDEAVPALRLRIESTFSSDDDDFAWTRYGFHSTEPVVATIFMEEDFERLIASLPISEERQHALRQSMRIPLAGRGGGEPPQASFVLLGDLVVSVDDGAAVSAAVHLDAPYPNPVAGTARFAVSLPQAGQLVVTVHDLLGREVARLADGPFAAGSHGLELPVAGLAPGLYVIRARGPGAYQARRLTVIR